MPFLLSNIDRAIIATQFDLRGYLHPLGFRHISKHEGIKGISFIPANLMPEVEAYLAEKIGEKVVVCW